MPAFTSFAIVGGLVQGTTGLGSKIARALISEGPHLSVRILTRPSSASSDQAKVLAASGIKIVSVDYDDEQSLVDSLTGVEVVISALSGGGIDVQPKVATAAARAGVKLFVPSEYGMPTHAMPPTSIHYKKTLLHAHLESLHLSYTLFYAGAFTQMAKFAAGPTLTPEGTPEMVLVNGAEGEVVWTEMGYVARYVAKVLATKPHSDLLNKTFIVPGHTASFSTLASFYTSILPNLPTRHTSITSDEAGAKGDRIMYLRSLLNEGGGVLVRDFSEDVLAGTEGGGLEGVVDVRELVRSDAEQRASQV